MSVFILSILYILSKTTLPLAVTPTAVPLVCVFKKDWLACCNDLRVLREPGPPRDALSPS